MMNAWTPEHGGITTAARREAMLAEQLAEDAARDARGIELAGVDIDDVVRGYLEAQLWSTADELYPHADNDLPADIEGVDRAEHGEMLDDFYDVDDIDGEYVDSVRSELRSFVASHPLAVRLYLRTRTAADFGHDLLLTRDRAGAGFWDRGLGRLGRYLSDHARGFGASESLTDGALCSDPAGERTFEAGKLYAS